MTHSELVKRATRWLKSSKQCGVILIEWNGGSRETPDAIGWRRGGRHSILVECKTSYEDFLSDSRKYFRKQPGRGLGKERYYMTPPGLLNPNELPPKWGLLEVHAKKITVKKKALTFDVGKATLRSENLLLFHALRCVTCEIAKENKDLGWFRLSRAIEREQKNG